jgi:TolA-binding protein
VDFLTVSIRASQAAPETVEIVQFLHRFADLISTAANSDNLLHAARLLEANGDMVRESNELLQVERARSDANSQLRKTLEEKIAGLEGEIVALKSQLSQQQVKLSEITLDAERRQAELLQRAEAAEARLTAIQNNPALAVSSGTHVLVPVTALRLAEAQFVSLARAFEKSGNIVSQVMCEASASNLDRTILDAAAPPSADRSKHAA